MGGLRLQLTLEGSRDCNIIFLDALRAAIDELRSRSPRLNEDK